MFNKTSTIGFGVALLALAVCGCSQESQQDYSDAGKSVSEAAKETGKGLSADTKTAGEAIKQDAEKAKESMSSASDKAHAALTNDSMSATVKSAISAAKDLQVTSLGVETNGNSITLRGSVPTAAQKARAEQIAKNEAGANYTIDDQIVVADTK